MSNCPPSRHRFHKLAPDEFYCAPENPISYNESLRGILSDARSKISHEVDVTPIHFLDELVDKRVISPWHSGFKVYAVVYGILPESGEALVVWGQEERSVSRVKLTDLKQLNVQLMQNVSL